MTSTPQDVYSYSIKIKDLLAGRLRAKRSTMPGPPARLASALFFTVASLVAGQSFLRTAEQTNVNQQYLIESVSVAGVQLDQVRNPPLPQNLRDRLKALIGERCDVATLDDLSSEIRRELHLRAVTEHLSKGSAPGRIKVNFEIVRRDVGFDISLPKFLYHSQQGFSGELEASTRLRNNTFTFGIVSNGDDLTERFSGMTARYDLGFRKVRFGLFFEDYHEQWNHTTKDAAAVFSGSGNPLDLYRSRRNIAPEFTFTVARPLTVSIGTSFEQMQPEAPSVPDRSANAATLDIHYGKKIEGSVLQQQIDGKYSLRVATRVLGSTYSYARHLISVRYEARSGRHVAAEQFIAGSIAGDAPLFERFVLGSSSTLRGWDRYEIDPLGGSRMVHNELMYGYRIGDGTVEAFYDTGSLWQSDRAAQLRHSLGFGYRQGIFVLTMAFPVRQGRIEPVFMAGMNY